MLMLSFNPLVLAQNMSCMDSDFELLLVGSDLDISGAGWIVVSAVGIFVSGSHCSELG